MVRQHHRLKGHEFEQTLGDGKRQGSLAHCSPWGCKESDTPQRLNSNERNKIPHAAQRGLCVCVCVCVCVYKRQNRVCGLGGQVGRRLLQRTDGSWHPSCGSRMCGLRGKQAGGGVVKTQKFSSTYFYILVKLFPVTRNAVGVIGLVLGGQCRVSFADVQQSCPPYRPVPCLAGSHLL